MADETNDTWRIQLGVRPGLEDPVPEAVLASTPRSDIYVGDQSIIFYPSTREAAQTVMAQQAANPDVVWVELARWDLGSAAWQTVEGAGRRDRSTATSSARKWKPGTWPLMLVVFVLTAAVMFLLAYFVPTLGADKRHDLAKSLAVAIFVGLICVVGSLFTTRRAEPPPP